MSEKTASTKNKEQIYDEQISPLMVQIIAICKEHNIAHLMSFSIPTDEDPDLAVTTVRLTSECNPPEELRNALRAIRPDLLPAAPMMIRTDHGDGSTTMTSIIG
ncbi:hypothetical protein QCE63_32280 [Caballeronia sp. LZ065]|uniref:hypothetical protein n=1 Tax=Caballeronia sp. LZ065 TaxID=3038571 RepID=UPI00285BEC23|nr:hypothetical protein [Caballeronia sp. LZ065]MDR5784100.1 hypothetical protein [Caballeronia sp. LZ065]